MTLGIARAATSPELALYRMDGKKSKLRAAIYSPATIYTARVNQTFSTLDQVLEITYDGGSGTLASVLADMTLLVGSSAGAHDKGICRIRSADATKFYISETSDIAWANDLYLTVIDDYGLWAKHVLIDDGVSYMDGGIAYSDQHSSLDPTPIMGSHRVLKLTGASVSATFDFGSSYALGSTISSYTTTSPTATGGENLNTSAPTLTWNTTGWHLVYLTLTAANGKTFFGVRYVYVWSDSAAPSSVVLDQPGRQDAEAGGWEFSISMLENVSLSDVRDRALVILFAEDWFGSTQQSIGPVVGGENIVGVGWIAEETINWNPEQGIVSFKIYGAHYWFSQIPAYPDGVEFVTTTPAAWTEMQNLTVRLGVWHFLHWRTTATRIMDVFLTDDTRLSKEVSSLAGNLWEQIREMAFLQIYARPGVNAHGQLFVQIHPQLVPEASRTWATVMTITKADWQGEINLTRAVKPEVSSVFLSGVAISSGGVATPYFSIAPGHTYPRYGAMDVQDNLLLSSQSQTNVLAGLYRSWRKNEYPEIPISLAADIRLIDCFPRSKCAIAITAGDTPRGISYSGNLIPTSISLRYDPETGYLSRDVTFEAETLESLAATNVVPGEGDRGVPPVPSLPPLPDFPVIIPGTSTPSANGPTKVLLLDDDVGLIFTENFDDASPTWYTVNAGLGTPVWGSTPPYQLIDRFFVCPNGAVYVYHMQSNNSADFAAKLSGDYFFLARAPSIGGTFSIIFDAETMGDPGDSRNGLYCAAYNPLATESVMVLVKDQEYDSGTTIHARIGANATWTDGVDGLPTTGGGSGAGGGLSYGVGKWIYQQGSQVWQIAYSGGSATSLALSELALNILDVYQEPIVRAGTSAKLFTPGDGSGDPDADIVMSTDNLTSHTFIDVADSFSFVGFTCDPSGSLLMSRWGTGSRGKSSDGGASWSALGSLPVGNYMFKWAGGSGVAESRWIAAGAVVRYSDDFGTTWQNREGNITSISPTPDIRGIWVVEY